MSDQAPEQSQDPMSALMGAIEITGTPDSAKQPEQPEGQPQAEAQAPAVDTAPEIQAETQTTGQKFRVRVKGDAGEDIDQEVTLDELQSSYQRHADYTRKTQELAREREGFRTQAQQAIGQELARQQQELQRLQAITWQTLAPELQGIDWQRIATEDPAQYVALQAKAQHVNGVLGAINQRMAQIDAARQAEDAAQKQQKQQAAAADLKASGFDLPSYQQALKSGLDYGFTPQEMHETVDARWIKVLRDAAKYRELQSAKPLADKKVAVAPPVVKPGAAVNQRAEGIDRARDRLKQSGSVRDLANAMRAMNL